MRDLIVRGLVRWGVRRTALSLLHETALAFHLSRTQEPVVVASNRR
jgi:hypothetical protein